MGIKFLCPNGHKLHVKSFLMGKRAICPKCGARVVVPNESTSTSAQSEHEAAVVELAGGSSEISTTRLRPPEPGTKVAADSTPPAAGSADPIGEEPTAVWYVRPATGGQFGPASGEIMRSWLNEGRVGASSLVWRAGWQDWRPAATTFPHLGDAPQDAVDTAARPGVPPPPASAANSANGPEVARPELPLGQIVQHVGLGPESAGSGVPSGNADLGNEIPVLPPGFHKRRRGNDINPLLTAILLGLTVILVIVLILVIWHNQTATDDAPEKSPEASNMTTLRLA